MRSLLHLFRLLVRMLGLLLWSRQAPRSLRSPWRLRVLLRSHPRFPLTDLRQPVSRFLHPNPRLRVGSVWVSIFAFRSGIPFGLGVGGSRSRGRCFFSRLCDLPFGRPHLCGLSRVSPGRGRCASAALWFWSLVRPASVFVVSSALLALPEDHGGFCSGGGSGSPIQAALVGVTS